MAQLSSFMDCDALLGAFIELHSLSRHGVPGHLRDRLERLAREGAAVELPSEDGGAPIRLGPSPELLCILATLRALKGTV